MKIQRFKKKNCERCGQKDTGLYPDTFYPKNKFYEGLVLHHIITLVGGGNNLENNLITLCYNCHKAVHTQPNGKNNWNYLNEEITNELILLKK